MPIYLFITKIDLKKPLMFLCNGQFNHLHLLLIKKSLNKQTLQRNTRKFIEGQGKIN